MPRRPDGSGLHQVPVSEADCRSRTDRILDKLGKLEDGVNTAIRKMDTHRAWHDGQGDAIASSRQARIEAESRRSGWVKWIALAFAILSAIIGAVWATAEAIRPSQAEQIQLIERVMQRMRQP